MGKSQRDRGLVSDGPVRALLPLGIAAILQLRPRVAISALRTWRATLGRRSSSDLGADTESLAKTHGFAGVQR
jgi:hypothetical protein